MTQPDGPINLSYSHKLKYADRDYAASNRTVPVSHTGAHLWTTLEWDTEVRDPFNMHQGARGWTVLRAPVDRDLVYDLNAFLRVQGGVAGCSTHLMPVHCRPAEPGEVDGVDNIVTYLEASEFFVGSNETHYSASGISYSNTHLLVPASDILPAGQLLRFVTDYWNAPSDAVPLKMCGATVSGLWGWL